jgi:hypothetical protein
MWGLIVLANSVCWVIAAFFLVHAAGSAVLLGGSWKTFLIAIFFFAFFSITAIIWAALAE